MGQCQGERYSKSFSEPWSSRSSTLQHCWWFRTSHPTYSKTCSRKEYWPRIHTYIAKFLQDSLQARFHDFRRLPDWRLGSIFRVWRYFGWCVTFVRIFLGLWMRKIIKLYSQFQEDCFFIVYGSDASFLSCSSGLDCQTHSLWTDEVLWHSPEKPFPASSNLRI